MSRDTLSTQYAYVATGEAEQASIYTGSGPTTVFPKSSSHSGESSGLEELTIGPSSADTQFDKTYDPGPGTVSQNLERDSAKLAYEFVVFGLELPSTVVSFSERSIAKDVQFERILLAIEFFEKDTAVPEPIRATTLDVLYNIKSAARKEAGIPQKAPAEWSARDRTKPENPAAFIKRVYAPWLGKVTRADIGKLDRPLYMAFAKWVERHGLDADLCLMGRSAEVDTELALRGITDPLDAFRQLPSEKRHDTAAVNAANRLYMAAKRRSRRRDSGPS